MNLNQRFMFLGSIRERSLCLLKCSCRRRLVAGHLGKFHVHLVAPAFRFLFNVWRASRWFSAKVTACAASITFLCARFTMHDTGWLTCFNVSRIIPSSSRSSKSLLSMLRIQNGIVSVRENREYITFPNHPKTCQARYRNIGFYDIRSIYRTAWTTHFLNLPFSRKSRIR